MRGGFRGGMMGRGHRFRGGLNSNGFVIGNAVGGKVTAVNGQQFTIDASGTTKTVQITDTTRFPVNSGTQVKVGDQVIVSGEQDSKGVIQATRVIDRTQTTNTNSL